MPSLLDLCYAEDPPHRVDMNIVMTGNRKFIELQGTGEEYTFDDEQLAEMLKMAKRESARLPRNPKKTLEIND